MTTSRPGGFAQQSIVGASKIRTGFRGALQFYSKGTLREYYKYSDPYSISPQSGRPPAEPGREIAEGPAPAHGGIAKIGNPKPEP